MQTDLGSSATDTPTQGDGAHGTDCAHNARRFSRADGRRNDTGRAVASREGRLPLREAPQKILMENKNGTEKSRNVEL